jgi:hypothetical protein
VLGEYNKRVVECNTDSNVSCYEWLRDKPGPVSVFFQVQRPDKAGALLLHSPYIHSREGIAEYILNTQYGFNCLWGDVELYLQAFDYIFV